MYNLNYTLKLLYCFSSYKISFGGRNIQILPWALMTLATTLCVCDRLILWNADCNTTIKIMPAKIQYLMHDTI